MTASELGLDLARRLVLAGVAVVAEQHRHPTPRRSEPGLVRLRRPGPAARRPDDRQRPVRPGLVADRAPGPWAVEAMAGSGIDPAVLRTVSAAAAATSTRILLVRRPGRRAVGPGSRLDRGRTDPNGPRHAGRPTPTCWSRQPPSDRWPIERRRRQPWIGGRAAAPPASRSSWSVRTAPTTPAARSAAARWPRRSPPAGRSLVWECSHLGGDRFAPNVVVLPDATYYGNLDVRLRRPGGRRPPGRSARRPLAARARAFPSAGPDRHRRGAPTARSAARVGRRGRARPSSSTSTTGGFRSAGPGGAGWRPWSPSAANPRCSPAGPVRPPRPRRTGWPRSNPARPPRHAPAPPPHSSPESGR